MVIEYKESAADKKALSTLGWQHRQQAVTGDVSTYTWKNHVQWYRDRKSQSLIWLMRRASRAVLSFRRHLIAADYLAYQGERARSLGFLMECGDRALAGTDVCTQTALDLASKAQHSRKFIALRKETQRVLCKLGEAAVKAVQAEYDRMRRRKRRRGVSGLRMVADDARAEGNKKSSGLQRTFSSFMDGTEDMNELGYFVDTLFFILYSDGSVITDIAAMKKRKQLLRNVKTSSSLWLLGGVKQTLTRAIIEFMRDIIKHHLPANI